MTRISSWTRDALHRIAWTFAQVAAGVITDQLVTGEITYRAVLIAGTIAALKAIPARIDATDVVERTVWTFAQASGALLVVQLVSGDAIAWQVIVTAGVLAAGKVGMAHFIGDPESAAIRKS